MKPRLWYLNTAKSSVGKCATVVIHLRYVASEKLVWCLWLSWAWFLPIGSSYSVIWSHAFGNWGQWRKGTNAWHVHKINICNLHFFIQKLPQTQDLKTRLELTLIWHWNCQWCWLLENICYLRRVCCSFYHSRFVGCSISGIHPHQNLPNTTYCF